MGILSFLFGTSKNDEKELNRLREVAGDPFTTDPGTVVEKIICDKLKLPEGYDLEDDQVLSEMECEEIDIVEVLMAVDDLYGEDFTYPDWNDDELNRLTVGDLIKYLKEFVDSRGKE